jgi:hypothetical protein
MTAKKIQPTNPSAAPSEARKSDDKNSTRKTAAASSKHRKTLYGNWR